MIIVRCNSKEHIEKITFYGTVCKQKQAGLSIVPVKKLDCINQVYLVDLVAIDSVDFTTKASLKMGDNVHEYCKLHWSKFKLKV